MLIRIKIVRFFRIFAANLLAARCAA